MIESAYSRFNSDWLQRIYASFPSDFGYYLFQPHLSSEYHTEEYQDYAADNNLPDNERNQALTFQFPSHGQSRQYPVNHCFQYENKTPRMILTR